MERLLFSPGKEDPDLKVKSRTQSMKSRTQSLKSLRHGLTPTDNVHDDPGLKPYIVAPGRKRAPKSEKKERACCTIL